MYQLKKILDLKLVNTSNKGFELTLDSNRLYKQLNDFLNIIDIFSARQLFTNLDVVLTMIKFWYSDLKHKIWFKKDYIFIAN